MIFQRENRFPSKMTCRVTKKRYLLGHEALSTKTQRFNLILSHVEKKTTTELLK